jgi:uncharacterized RDD family membrane protein YckC
VTHEIVEVVTPEGVPLRFKLAHAGDRASAFAIDFVLIMVVSVGLVLLASLATGGLGGSWAWAFTEIAVFLLQSFYFAWFEIRWLGATPGKRRIGLRVIDRKGGQLTASAVVARNLVRNIEVFLPLAVALAPEQLWPDAPGWLRLVAGAWTFVFLLMPAFNKQRLRIGDMVGGTLVVLMPKAMLLPDVAAQPAAARLAFTDAQLDVYGIKELQVLEGVLRSVASPQGYEAADRVAEQIQKKIGWDGAALPPEGFLGEFYAALRARLEHRMLLGKRKADKFS